MLVLFCVVQVVDGDNVTRVSIFEDIIVWQEEGDQEEEEGAQLYLLVRKTP